MVPQHTGCVHVLVIDRVVGSHQLERRLVVKVLSLALHRLMCLRQQLLGEDAGIA
jgi:hypothetical protein